MRKLIIMFMILASGTAQAAGLNIFKKSDISEYNGQYLIVDFMGQKVVLNEERQAIAALDIKKLRAACKTGLNKDLVFKFKNAKEAEEWLKSSYPDYKCWTSRGVEDCK